MLNSHPAPPGNPFFDDGTAQNPIKRVPVSETVSGHTFYVFVQKSAPKGGYEKVVFLICSMPFF